MYLRYLEEKIIQSTKDIKHEKLQKNAIETKYKKHLSDIDYINYKKNCYDKDKEIEKLKNQVDNLISIMYDIRTKNTSNLNNEATSKSNIIKLNNVDNVNTSNLQNETTSKSSIINLNNVDNVNKNIVCKKFSNITPFKSTGMTLIEELKNKLKESKYQIDMN